MPASSSKNQNTRLRVDRPIVRYSAFFLACFVVASGFIGWRIIEGGIVEHYGFQVYGEAGKALLLGVLAFLLLVHRQRPAARLQSWQRNNLWWLSGTVGTTILCWYLIGKLLLPHPSILWAVGAHICILGTIGFLLCLSFGIRNIRIIWEVYSRAILIAIAIGAVFIGFLYLLYLLWPLMSSIVLKAVKVLLGFVHIKSVYLPPRTLVFNKFGISIGKYCSGIDSLALFTALYILIGILDWPRFDHKKYMIAILPAVLALLSLNILRVFILILAGYFINPQIAFTLFHTYAGMVFFILYSIIFWGFSYKWMLRKV